MKEKVYDTGLEVDVVEALPDLPGLPDVYRGRSKADALMVPNGYMGVVSEHVRAGLLNVRFRRVVETDAQGRLHTKGQTAGLAFVVGDPLASLNYNLNDPFHPGRPRYDWYRDDADHGVQYGFLKK
jgi:hypothetical protein